MGFEELLESFRSLRVGVIGDAMLDRYIEGEAERMCREAPVPVIEVTQRTDAPGGAANTAVNIAGLGAQVHLAALIGDDPEGATLSRLLAAQGVHLLGEAAAGRRTTTKTRCVAESQLLVRFDEGSSAPLCDVERSSLERAARALFADCHAVVLADYDGALFDARMLEALTGMREQFPGCLVVDSRRQLVKFAALRPTMVKPNYKEALELLNVAAPPPGTVRAEAVLPTGGAVLERTGAAIAAVTLDRDGALVFERQGRTHRTFGAPVTSSQACGAGDSYLAAFTLALAAGETARTAADCAAAAAAVVVQKEGTVSCSVQELRAQWSGLNKLIDNLELLDLVIRRYRLQGRRIAFTNGCFEILHEGSIACLCRAKEAGDVLIVGVNSDASISRIKGPGRPINSLEQRIRILQALGYIDHIVPFEEDTACALVERIAPDVFVKGANHAIEQLPEVRSVRERGGTILIVPLHDGGSTRGIIERIRTSTPHDEQSIEAAGRFGDVLL